jgi:CBS domain-containing protein
MATLTARDIMTREVLTVREDLTVAQLATVLSEREISGAPVVDSDHRLVGVVSSTDVMEAEGSAPGAAEARLARGRGTQGSGHGPLVEDIMTPTVYTIPEDTPVGEIAKTMIAGRIHRLFVTHLGRVVGIVTSLDLVQLLVDSGRPKSSSKGKPPRRVTGRSRGGRRSR